MPTFLAEPLRQYGSRQATGSAGKADQAEQTSYSTINRGGGTATATLLVPPQAVHTVRAPPYLGHVQVHFVPVEVGVVGRRHREVHPEGRPVEHLHAVPHDGHLVERRLPVEDDDVVVPKVPLHRVAVLQGQAVFIAHEPEVHAHTVVPHDVPSCGIGVVGIYFFGEGGGREIVIKKMKNEKRKMNWN